VLPLHLGIRRTSLNLLRHASINMWKYNFGRLPLLLTSHTHNRLLHMNEWAMEKESKHN